MGFAGLSMGRWPVSVPVPVPVPYLTGAGVNTVSDDDTVDAAVDTAAATDAVMNVYSITASCSRWLAPIRTDSAQ